MRVSRRPTLAALVVLTVLAAVAPPAAAARRPGGIAFRPCPEDRTAECGSLRVPVDWSDGYGPTAEIAVARRAATDPRLRIGTLVVNPGGPGGSGVDLALSAETFFSPAVRARFDIVGFDPRGVARSNPVVCSSTLTARPPSPLIGTEAQYDATIAYNRKLAADCRRRTGPVFDHVDTGSVVRDLEALRKALGETTISFYGASYGTLIGAQYAERYPNRVRALALDSVMDHSGGTDDFLGTETASVQGAFDEFVSWCARDRTCALHGRDVKAVWAALLARARAGTLRDPYDPDLRVSPFDLVGVAFTSFYDPQYVALGTYLKEALATPVGRRAAMDDVEHPFPAVFCEDWDLPVGGWTGYRATLAALAGAAPQMLASPLALSAVTGCLGWPSAPDNPQRELRPARVPTLLINARHDPATAYAWAENVARQLGPNADLVTYEGWGHVVYGRTTCVTRVVDRYLIELRRPAAGTSCAGVIPDPFGVGKRARPGLRPGLHRGYR